MYLKVNSKKIEIKEYIKFKDRFKSFRFYLYPIDFGIRYNKKKIASTYFFCQKVDICFTDKDNIILDLYHNVPSERRLFDFKAYYIYYLPLETCKYLEIGKKLDIKEK